jgi:hypothetical protein
MGIDYFTGFPTQEDSLGGTQQRFFTNTASVKAFLDINHYDFNNALYGNHKWVMFGRQTANWPDTTSPSTNTIAIYGAADTTSPLPITQLWFQPPNTAVNPVTPTIKPAGTIQLTAGDVTNAKFSTNTTYEAHHNGGWTFLPGKLLLQYGTIDPNAADDMPSTGTVNFPIAFSDVPYSLVFGVARDNGSSSAQNIYYNTLAAASFKFSSTSDVNRQFSWVAIGPA